MQNILITGGSGLIGQELSKRLTALNYGVSHLTRTLKQNAAYKQYRWDIAADYIDEKAFEETDIIIHLAGENVSNGRWTAQQKQKILDSRIKSAELISKHLKDKKLNAFISASGISYYGTVTSPQIFNETDSAGTDFLAQVSVKWENAVHAISAQAERVAILRTGVVLSQLGGALKKMVSPIKMGIGSPLGSGNQYLPWIHVNDMVNMYVHAVQNNQFSGIYNAVASQHCTNKEMTEAIAKALNKKLWAPNVPTFVLKGLFGEMADIILKGSRIDNALIKSTGFSFEYDDLEQALKNLLTA